MKSTRMAVMLAVSMLLAACGGGGSDGTHSPTDAVDRSVGTPTPVMPPVTTPTILTHDFPVGSIMASLALEPLGGPVLYTYTATSSNGTPYQLVIARETKANVTFNSTTATPMVVTETLRKGRTSGSSLVYDTVYVNIRDEYFEPSPSFEHLGTTGTATHYYIVTRVDDVVPLPYPTTARIGSIGPLRRGHVVIDNINGFESHSWEVRSDTDTTARVCEVIAADANVANEDVYTTYPRTYCHRVNESDQVVGHTLTLRFDGELLYFQTVTP
ncbi:MAG: hypothetical protein QM742_04585 [Aquabacterium sp.]